MRPLLSSQGGPASARALLEGAGKNVTCCSGARAPRLPDSNPSRSILSASKDVVLASFFPRTRDALKVTFYKFSVCLKNKRGPLACCIEG